MSSSRYLRHYVSTAATVTNFAGTPGAGVLQLTGTAPSLKRTFAGTPGAGVLQLTGAIPTLAQVGAVASVTTTAVGHGRRRKRKEYVVIDDVVFEVADDAEAIALIRRAHELARENAQAAAAAKLAQQQRETARRKKAPAKIEPPEPDAPQITLSPGLQPIWPQVVQVRDEIAEVYRAALIAAWLRQQEDEEDIETLLLS